MSTAQAPAAIEAFYEPVLPYLDPVREKIRQIVPPDSQLLAEPLYYSLGSRGKLLRPVVGLLASGASLPAGCHALSDQHLETAAVSEMIHIATLLHDDVLDDADLRRGQKTVRNLWGNAVSILGGDYLLAQASRKLAQVGNIRIVAIFSDVLASLCDGEVEQIRLSYNLEALETCDWQGYYRKSICKTASLFAAACESAGVLNGLPDDQTRQLRQYGEAFGIAFQIVDDLLDYTSSEAEMGKPVFGDLKNGLLNAPILLALESERLILAEQADLKMAIRTLFETDTPGEADLEAVRSLLEKSEAVQQTQALAERFIREALEALDFLPDSAEKRALADLGRFVVERRQ